LHPAEQHPVRVHLRSWSVGAVLGAGGTDARGARGVDGASGGRDGRRRVCRPAAVAAEGAERQGHRMTKIPAQEGESPSQLIDAKIKELGDWRGKTLARVRALIKKADPEVVEEWKWRKATSPGVPVWSHKGGICTGETYTSVVKLTFFKGASLKDPSRLFNSSLEGNTRRAIDIHEDDV